MAQQLFMMQARILAGGAMLFLAGMPGTTMAAEAVKLRPNVAVVDAGAK